MSKENIEEIIQYVPFMSFVHPSFWHRLTETKLEVDKLSESSKQIHGRYTYRSDIGPVFEVDGTSFNENAESEQLYINVTGTLLNKNTVEDFKALDKASLLNSIGETIWANIKVRSWISNPELLLNFFVLSFADLKKFHYYYWFAFPSPSQPTVFLHKIEPISAVLSETQVEQLKLGFKSLDNKQKCFFTVHLETANVVVNTLATSMQDSGVEINTETTYFAFVDPSNTANPGWSLRLYMAALLQHQENLRGQNIKFIGIRIKATGAIDSSQIFHVKVPQDAKAVESAGWVGWERNDKGNFGPKLANMSASMDPIKLAEASSDLNIKLMKWRLVPDIDVDVMKTVKCLLLGAGTLGCHVARNLLAWGFRHITFVDNGKVSYSNPTRQVLYSHSDCLHGGKKKAEAAAENLKLILPSVKSTGIIAHIPMPGHPIGDSLRSETLNNIKVLTEAIAEHDVIFLLLDTREARWMPTLIAAHYGKIVINAALGFDSYLVIRHGVGHSETQTVEGAMSSHDVSGDVATSSSSLHHLAYVGGCKLGCYFCNDVTAPGNSLKERTLDQQCTVTRPGVAAIAGALAVEVLVSLLQHPLRGGAPALCNMTDSEDLPSEVQGVLGPIPHSIRGFLHSYQTVVPTCTKFRQCIACSDVVIKKYREEGSEFLLKVFNSGTYLEDITGLSELHLTAEMTDILTFSDDDE